MSFAHRHTSRELSWNIHYPGVYGTISINLARVSDASPTTLCCATACSVERANFQRSYDSPRGSGTLFHSNRRNPTRNSPAAHPSNWRTGAFEVSTVRLNKSGSGNSGSDFNNGRFIATNIQLKSLMEYSACGIPQPRILGGPRWLDSERFDIEAKMESAAAERLKASSRDQRRAETQAMFQQLLADRFKLAVHWEMRELLVYALVAAKNGPILQESKNAPGEAGTSSGDGQFSAKGMTLTEIAEALTQELSRELGRVVIDKTGILGRYDIAPQMDA